jgi:hypothetical protein
VTGYFPIRKPTIGELENEAAYPHVDLTAEEPIWDPQSPGFAKMEDRMVYFQSCVLYTNSKGTEGHKFIVCLLASKCC